MRTHMWQGAGVCKHKPWELTCERGAVLCECKPWGLSVRGKQDWFGNYRQLTDAQKFPIRVIALVSWPCSRNSTSKCTWSAQIRLFLIYFFREYILVDWERGMDFEELDKDLCSKCIVKDLQRTNKNEKGKISKINYWFLTYFYILFHVFLDVKKHYSTMVSDPKTIVSFEKHLFSRTF